VKNAPTRNLILGIRPKPRPINHYRTELSREIILKSSVSTGPYRNFINEIILLTERRKSSYVCFANVDIIVEASKDAAFNNVINGADIVAPDGKPLSLFLRLFKRTKQDRVCGLTILPDLFKQAENQNKSVYLYGTTDDVLFAVVAKAKKDFPSLRISGYYSPPFRELTKDEKEAIIKNINSSQADLVLVALDPLKQEKWMAEHKGKIMSCMLGFGEALKAYAKVEKRLPSLTRYFYTNGIFLLLTFEHMIHHVLSKNPEIKFIKGDNA
jgi:N-acetylglucosaminyldiphosphoundecaprenol N-acetyl-beta-D-mannosaminyltransferase